jgi:hypothetical protein
MKQYMTDGVAGLIECRRNRITKFEVGLYHAQQGGIDTDEENPWATVCHEHGNFVVHPSLGLARAHMAYPEWCEDCQPLLDLKPQGKKL